MTREPGARLPWEGSYNARDLGGHPTVDGGTVRWGAVVRADNLAMLTRRGWASLHGYGVRTLIDLRHDAELRRGTTYETGGRRSERMQVPIFEEHDRDVALAIYAAETQLEAYKIMLSRCRERFATVLSRVRAAPKGAVAIHCQSGRDRTGLVAALLLGVAGATERAVEYDYALSAPMLAPLDEHGASQTPAGADRKTPGSPSRSAPETMRALLDWLRRQYGGIVDYLLGSGMTESELAQVRARLR
jgi:protein-tyrosine phosphatase